MINYYYILNLDFRASENLVRTRFKELAKKHHPDINNGSKESEEYFKSILAAYETLSDESKRFQYDIKLAKYQNATQDKRHHSNIRKEYYKEPRTKKSKVNNRENSISINTIKAWLFIIAILIAFLFYFNKEKKEHAVYRPPSGEINFKN